MTQSGETLRLVGYSRVSTEEQSTEGVSLDAQESRLRAYAIAHGAELVSLERDEGVSGKIAPERRSGLVSALSCVRSGDAEGLLVTKLDRLSRTTRHVLDLVDTARRHGWRLVSVSEHLDTGSAAGRMVLTVLAALAEMERAQVGERTSEALAQVAREGRVRSHRLPFGWRTESGSDRAKKGQKEMLVAHPEEQAIRSRMLELRADGLGAHRIAGRLNGDGIKNPRTLAPWTPGTVASILRTADRLERAGATA